MANIQKQHAEQKGRKRFKMLFAEIRGQVSDISYMMRDYQQHVYSSLFKQANTLAICNNFVKT